MSDILLRGLSKEDADILDLKAKAEGKDRMNWLVDQLHKMAVTPSQYAYRVYGTSGGKGTIRRYSDHPNGTSPTFSNFNQDEADAMEHASNFIRRNAPGDRERAYSILVEQFGEDKVFEIPA
jgi:hypothetical protein